MDDPSRASSRAVSTGTTGGLANPVLSVLEDVTAFAFAVLAFVIPIVVAALVLLGGWLGWRWVRRRRRETPTVSP